MPKNIVLCFDGTYNQIGLQKTNVLRLFEALKSHEAQHVFYDPGVGTLTDPNSLTKLRKQIRQVIDLMTGVSLCDNVVDGYRFLMSAYEPGDRIYLFGFSRGAYTAKALAGALHMFGLLRRGHENLAPYVWQTYSDQKPDIERVSELYRTYFSHDSGRAALSGRTVSIEFLGLWDTVSSFGLFWDFKTLRYTRSNPSVRIVRHALALDERRGMFKANHCEALPGQDVKEVWFAGYHSDVGGHPLDRAELSDIALRWMLGEAKSKHLKVDLVAVDKIPTAIPTDPGPALHDSMSLLWRILEFMPILGYSARRRKRVMRWPNLFRRRPVWKTEYLHQSVAGWLAAGTYKPANVKPGMPVAPTLELVDADPLINQPGRENGEVSAEADVNDIGQ